MKRSILIKAILVAVSLGGFLYFIMCNERSASPSMPTLLMSAGTPPSPIMMVVSRITLPGEAMCDQSTTTTPCSVIIELMNSQPQTPLLITDLFTTTTPTWKKYSSRELGASILYPDYNVYSQSHVSTTRDSEMGGYFSLTALLPSGTKIEGIAMTVDINLGKDGSHLAVMGYRMKDGVYYTPWPNGTYNPTFVPDEFWPLKNGSSAAVVYGKAYDNLGDYPEATVTAYVNIPNSDFTGIGFQIYNQDKTGYHPASPEDIAVFKKMVTSIEF